MIHLARSLAFCTVVVALVWVATPFVSGWMYALVAGLLTFLALALAGSLLKDRQ